MDSFTIRPTAWPVLRIFSRNPLMRKADRIEAAINPLAVLLMILATACAGIIGTIAHDVESQRYLDEVKTRHTIMATAIEDSSPRTFLGPDISNIQVRWHVNGADRTASVASDKPVKFGEALQIWVDAQGNQVDPPTPPALAGGNAVLVGAVAWWIFFIITALSLSAMRMRLARSKNAQWDREIRHLIDDWDGRTKRPQ